MNKFKRLFRQTETHVILFFVFFLLYSWPFFNLSIQKTDEKLFCYLFLVWVLNIIVLYVISKSISSSDKIDEEKEKD